MFSFSHPISRPYPYSWFKWLVFTGGIVATTFFTALNLAADGYDLKLQHTQDYNGTVNQKQWTQTFPFNVLGHTTTVCQSMQMALNSQFWTDKLGLPYTLTRAWQDQNGTIVENPGLTYTNNRLEDCSISFIKIDLTPLDIANTQLISPSPGNPIPAGTGDLTWSPKATAYVNCTINNDIYPTFLNLAVDYSSLTPAGIMDSFPRTPDETMQASLWWGKSLLSWYWSNLAQSAWGNGYTSGAIDLLPQNNPNGSSIDIISPDFFSVSGFWFKNPSDEQAFTGAVNSPAALDSPDVGTQVDYFAKSMYATVLADLGQHSNQTPNNVLLQPHLLEFLSANISDLYHQAKANPPPWISAGPAIRGFNPAVDPPLNITDSFVYAQYLCQVPTLKSTGSLLVSVIVADLVLLQALWKLVTWVTTAWLERRDSQANFCEGCLMLMRSEEAPPSSPPPVDSSAFRPPAKTTQYLLLPREA